MFYYSKYGGVMITTNQTSADILKFGELLLQTGLFEQQEAIQLSSLKNLSSSLSQEEWESFLKKEDPYFFQHRLKSKRYELSPRLLAGPISAWLAFIKLDVREEKIFATIYEHTLPDTKNIKAQALFVAEWLTNYEKDDLTKQKIASLFFKKQIALAYRMIMTFSNT